MNPESYSSIVYRLKSEIRHLTEEQTDAMETETFIGMTKNETKEYDARRAKIAELVRQLRVLEAAA